MRDDDAIRVRHMIEACESIERFVTNRSRADLDADEMLAFAVVRALEMVGEAASKTSPELRAAYDAIPWRAIAGMRNRLVHAYFDIDRDIVWVAATREAPALREALLRIGKSV